LSEGELLEEIEQLRAYMITLAENGADYEVILQVSQELDEYIAQYQRTIM